MAESVGKSLSVKRRSTAERLKRLDSSCELKEKLLAFCRLTAGDVWEDPVKGHKVGVLDAAEAGDVEKLFGGAKVKNHGYIDRDGKSSHSLIQQPRHKARSITFK